MSGRSNETVLALADTALCESVRAAAASRLDFEATYDEYFEFVWRNLRRLGVHEDGVDDALQDVFVVVHRRLADYDGQRATLRSWLFGIVLRVAKDHRRTRTRKDPAKRAGDFVDPDSLAAMADTDPQERAELAERISLLHCLLDQIDEKKRTMLILAELEQMTAPEIASALQIPLNTVYSRLRTAREDLQDALARHRSSAGERR